MPTNFTALRSRLVLVLLFYHRLESGSGATFAKLPKYRMKKSPIPQYRKPPCPPPVKVANFGTLTELCTARKEECPQILLH